MLQLHDAKYFTLLSNLWPAARRRSVWAHLAVSEKRKAVILRVPEHTGVKHDAEMVAQDM